MHMIHNTIYYMSLKEPKQSISAHKYLSQLPPFSCHVSEYIVVVLVCFFRTFQQKDEQPKSAIIICVCLIAWF